jgi:hypothetical protein
MADKSTVKNYFVENLNKTCQLDTKYYIYTKKLEK